MSVLRPATGKVARTANYVQIAMGSLAFLVGMASLSHCLFLSRPINEVAYILIASGLYVATGFDVTTLPVWRRPPK